MRAIQRKEDKDPIFIDFDLKGLEIGKNTVLVVRCDESITHWQARQIADQMREALGKPVIVLAPGIEVETMERSELLALLAESNK